MIRKTESLVMLLLLVGILFNCDDGGDYSSGVDNGLYNSCTITFNSNGGSEIEAVTVEESTYVDAPINPVKSGYSFLGWYSDSEFENEWGFESPVIQDLILFAKWAQKITLNSKQLTYTELVLNGVFLEHEDYGGTIGGIESSFKFVDDSTLSFTTPYLDSGTYGLIIDEIDDYSIEINIEPFVLSGTPINIVTMLEDTLSVVISSLSDTTSEYLLLQDAFESFKTILADASDEKIKEIAIFYEGNKEVFDEILFEDYGYLDRNRELFNVSTNLKFKLSVLALGAGVAYTYYATPEQKLVGVLIALVGWKASKSFGAAVTDERLKVIASIIGGFESELDSRKSSRQTDSILTLEIEKEYELPFKLDIRRLDSTDVGDLSSGNSMFFKSFDSFNGIIVNINKIIDFVNENVPLISLEKVDEFPLSENSALNETAVTDSILNNIVLSIDHSDLDLSYHINADGVITINVTSGSPDLDLSSPLDTQLKIEIRDEFNTTDHILAVQIKESDKFAKMNGWYVGNYRLNNYYNEANHYLGHEDDHDIGDWDSICDSSCYALWSCGTQFGEQGEVYIYLNGVGNTLNYVIYRKSIVANLPDVYEKGQVYSHDSFFTNDLGTGYRELGSRYNYEYAPGLKEHFYLCDLYLIDGVSITEHPDNNFCGFASLHVPKGASSNKYCQYESADVDWQYMYGINNVDTDYIGKGDSTVSLSKEELGIIHFLADSSDSEDYMWICNYGGTMYADIDTGAGTIPGLLRTSYEWTE